MNRNIREWLKTLPEPYKKKALMNATVEDKSILNRSEPSLYDAIGRAFNWNRSPEGSKYWETLYYKAQRGEVIAASPPVILKRDRTGDNLPF